MLLLVVLGGSHVGGLACVCVCVCFPVSPSLSSGNQHVVTHRSPRSSFSLARSQEEETHSVRLEETLSDVNCVRPWMDLCVCTFTHSACQMWKGPNVLRETKQKHQLCDGRQDWTRAVVFNLFNFSHLPQDHTQVLLLKYLKLLVLSLSIYMFWCSTRPLCYILDADLVLFPPLLNILMINFSSESLCCIRAEAAHVLIDLFDWQSD